MTDIELKITEPAFDHAAEAPADVAFDWRNTWYPITFLRDLAKDRPSGFAIYDVPLVLFVDYAGKIVCLRDRCPHRAARLSDGQIVDGRLECRYHGWQFGAGGRCLHIPQLLARREVPARSQVQDYPVAVQGEIVWVWAGDPELADLAQIPVTARANEASNFSVTFQMDLPYDQSYLIENIIDIAHIHIAHHGVRGGGLREAAKPVDFQIEDISISGIRSTFRSVGLVRADGSQGPKGATVEFVAPNLVRYASNYADTALVAGLELFSLPIGKSRCRLLYRKYSNFTSGIERRKPRWLEHLTQCKILEQDMAVVTGQAADIDGQEAELRDVWLPLKSSDRLVVEYRKWLDRFGGTLPFYRGFASSRKVGGAPHLQPLPTDRHTLHTRICLTCGRLDRNLGRAIAGLWTVVVAAAAVALLLRTGLVSTGMVMIGLASLLGILAARHLKSRL